VAPGAASDDGDTDESADELDATAAARGDADEQDETTSDAPRRSNNRRRRGGRSRGGAGATGNGDAGNGDGDEPTPRPASANQDPNAPHRSADVKAAAMPELTIDDHARLVTEFLEGLVTSFGLEATTSWETVDEDTAEVKVEGANLGLLVGPKGRTLQAISEIARSVAVRHGEGGTSGRVHIDIAGYRQRRREALIRFTGDVATQVIESGTPKALEPMSAADRKIVHDAVNELEGVASTSEGEEPNRRVVILPS
jgi:spoIIIJ-associated protein